MKARERKDRVRRRDWIVAALVALVAASGVGLFAMPALAGLSTDLLFWLRHNLAPVSRASDASHAVVIAIDEETYRVKPFADLPNALWTKQIASVLDQLVAADVKVIGFDVIFPTSIERLVPGFDREFLQALHNAARSGKVVLGEVQHQQFPIHPFASQIFAVGNERNVRSVNLFRDDDEMIRRVPLGFETAEAGAGGHAVPSMALELAARAAGEAPQPLKDGRLSLAGRIIPGSDRNAMMLDFPDGEIAPTYSLADLQACAAKGDTEFFRQHFAGKVVLLGAVLDVEDRKLTSMRFITAPEHEAAGARCALPARTDLFRSDLVRDSIAGVYLFATAVDNLLEGTALDELGPVGKWLLLIALALGAAWLALRLPPLWGGIALVIGGLLWTAFATFVFRQGLVLPLLAPPFSAALAFAILLGYRIVVTDRDRRLLRSSFALYLSPALIDRMLGSDRLPELGGEQREVTVFFSDLAGFTTLSERLAPAELVAVMNAYLTAMTDIIEAEGGFVDKYVGDAIVALFGAPLDDPRHALHAVRAALACRDRLAAMGRDPAIFRGLVLRARIGLSTGPALVGNIGSRRRFNYTALGDTVNLAARLEGANKLYGTSILAAAATREAGGDAIDWREIDCVRVVGRGQPVTIFEPVGAASAAPAADRADARRAFAEALAAYRAGRFEAALRIFDVLATEDPAASMFAQRARHLLTSPPPAAWDGITQLETK